LYYNMTLNFTSTLRLNILEMTDYGKNRLNRKKYSIVDFYHQLENIYQFADQKPTKEDIENALQYLIDRSLLDKLEMGDVFVYAINEEGRELLQLLNEGDDTAII
ncbi:MAG: hypothetical protein OEZ01_05250, partial [Candidatus Heimdallarchaeota archaeon]|nr:hypothetical protein [Candidatus Heimdallarchaeota archaeon]